ncbi:AfsR/SARP family transcriptional regulator [Catellatospora sp. NPDC049133]|uniref:AfsR/SARP family transcriptional regulator n=1 Tax=Catellatospora sp. NPDC049133 TaxID=3155499 RepID=UPI0033C403C5
MVFRILGPVEVRRDGLPVVLGGRKQRTTLALLLLHRGRTVSVAKLAAMLWGLQPPPSMPAQVHNLVSRVRRAVGHAATLRRSYDGYTLLTHDGDLDLARFDADAAAGRAAMIDGDPHRAAGALRNALEHWRGPALHGVTEHLAEQERHHLEERRLEVLADRIEADLCAGAAARLVPELTGLVHAWPFHDRFRGQLMRSLHASGRRAEALASFTDASDRYRRELGLSPHGELLELHARILRA